MEDGAHEKPDQNPVAIGLTQQLLVADGGLNSYIIERENFIRIYSHVIILLNG